MISSLPSRFLAAPFARCRSLSNKVARASKNVAIVRPPPPNFADGIVTHLSAPVGCDAELARQQWRDYCGVFERHKLWSISVLPEATSDGLHCPDGVFVEDTAVLFWDGVRDEHVAVLCCNMKERRRPGEGAACALAH